MKPGVRANFRIAYLPTPDPLVMDQEEQYQLEIANQKGGPTVSGWRRIDSVTLNDSGQLGMSMQGTPPRLVGFHDEYKAWKEGREAPIQGLPLTEWPGMDLALVAPLQYMGVRSVEDLLAVPDQIVTSVQGGLALRIKAEAWKKASDDGTGKMIAENIDLRRKLTVAEAEIVQLRGENTSLGHQLAAYRPAPMAPVLPTQPIHRDLSSLQGLNPVEPLVTQEEAAALLVPPKRGPGRPSKAA